MKRSSLATAAFTLVAAAWLPSPRDGRATSHADTAGPAAGCTPSALVTPAQSPSEVLSRLSTWATSVTSPQCSQLAASGQAAVARAGVPATNPRIIATVAGGGVGDYGAPLQAEFFLPGPETFDTAGN